LKIIIILSIYNNIKNLYQKFGSMGCASNFSSASSQTELERRIREKRKENDLKLSKYIMSSINENINILSKGN